MKNQAGRWAVARIKSPHLLTGANRKPDFQPPKPLASPKRGEHSFSDVLGAQDRAQDPRCHPQQCAQQATCRILPLQQEPDVIYYLQVTMAAFTTFILCVPPPIPSPPSGCLGFTSNTSKSLPLLAMNQCPCRLLVLNRVSHRANFQVEA